MPMSDQPDLVDELIDRALEDWAPRHRGFAHAMVGAIDRSIAAAGTFGDAAARERLRWAGFEPEDFELDAAEVRELIRAEFRAEFGCLADSLWSDDDF